MTTHNNNQGQDIDREVAPLDPWMSALVRDLDDDVVVPRELMWARIRKERLADMQRRQQAQRRTRGAFAVFALAATLVIGIGVGRMSMTPASNATPSPGVAVATGDSIDRTDNSPVRVAMNEHFVKTALLLTSIRAQEPDERPRADLAEWSQELLSTTRLLLDSPELAGDALTRRLLEDLEVVLMQIIQSRGTAAPEARRAPGETMRETNLLPRVRAAVITASAFTNGAIAGGASE